MPIVHRAAPDGNPAPSGRAPPQPGLCRLRVRPAWAMFSGPARSPARPGRTVTGSGRSCRGEAGDAG